jgi:hypothetical protein
VEGPSIRLAEVIAQNWGNLSFGVKELEQREGESVAMAYAWDLETNVRQEKVFTVKHSRKAGGKIKKLDDPRDIYELVANNGARRVRACILGVIPGDIVDNAVEECSKTMKGGNKGPFKDRISKTLELFKEKYGVTQEQIETKVGYNVSAFTEYDLVGLGKIFTSLKDGMGKVEDFFSKDVKKESNSDLSQAFNKTTNTKSNEDGKQPDKSKNYGKSTTTTNSKSKTESVIVDATNADQIDINELPFD